MAQLSGFSSKTYRNTYNLTFVNGEVTPDTRISLVFRYFYLGLLRTSQF